MRTQTTDEPRRLPTNLSLSESLVTEAKKLDINLSRAAEQGLAAAVAAELARRWKEENRAAIDAQNAWVAEHGLPLAKYRMF
jgi:antitoxin CcdA